MIDRLGAIIASQLTLNERVNQLQYALPRPIRHCNDPNSNYNSYIHWQDLRHADTNHRERILADFLMDQMHKGELYTLKI